MLVGALPVLFVARPAMSVSIEIGSSQFPVNAPFCGACLDRLRYQVLVPGSELGGSSLFSLSIGSVSFRTAGADSVTFQSFEVYAGTASADTLAESFEDNYRDERTLLYSAGDVTFSPCGGWVTIPLEREYLFHGADSIVMEILYSGADAGALYCGYRETEDILTVYTGNQDAIAGGAQRFAPHLLLSGTAYFQSLFGMKSI